MKFNTVKYPILLGFYIMFLLLTIPYVRRFQDFVKTQKLTSLYDIVLIFFIILISIFIFYNLVYKKRISIKHLISYGMTIGIFVLGMETIGLTVERVHFLQYGLLVLLLYLTFQKMNTDLSLYFYIFQFSLAVGIADEWIQWYIPSRFGELRDIYINLLATLFGILVIHFFLRKSELEKTIPRYRVRSLLWSFMLLGLELTIFIQCAHHGFLIVDPETGSFRSSFTQQELADRNLQYIYPKSAQIQPLRKDVIKKPQNTYRDLLNMWQKEDFYKTEAEFHCGERNRALDNHDYVVAHFENLILEKYYFPLIKDSPFRWDEVKKRQINGLRKGQQGAQSYISPVLDHIWTSLNTNTIWAIFMVYAAGLMLAARRFHTPAA